MITGLMAVLSTFLFKYISIFGSFGVRSVSVWDPFGIRLGSVRPNFGPKFLEPKIQIFDLCGRRRSGGGPLAAVSSPAARRAPAVAVMAAQIENFWNFQILAPNILVRNWPERSPN